VVVTGPGVTKQFIEAGELAETAPGGTGSALPYTLRARPGEAGELISRGGMPVREVIRKAGVDPDTVGYITVPRPGGTTAYLPESDFAEPPPYPQGPALITVEREGARTRFLRPVTADQSDVNAEDNITTVAGEALAVGIHNGHVLSVQASASPTSTQAGQQVQFSAVATGAEPEEQISSYAWSFGDGTTADGQSVSHTFSGSGTYAVRVTATGSAGSGGESGPVEVVVGNPPTTAQPGAAPAQAKPKRKQKANGPSGKGRQGQGGNGGRHDGHTGGGDGSAASSPSEPSSGAPAPPTPEPTSEPTPPRTERTEPTEPAAPPPAAKQPPSSAQALTGGETVEGTLVADVFEPAPAAAGGSSSGSGSQSAPGAVDYGGGASVPVAALIVLGLLAAGVLLEWRGAPPRLR
jgi:PKD repeat protein